MHDYLSANAVRSAGGIPELLYPVREKLEEASLAIKEGEAE
jgi:hypothetical protein